MIALQNTLLTNKVHMNMHNNFCIERIHINMIINTGNISGRLQKTFVRVVAVKEGGEKLSNVGRRKNHYFPLHMILTF